MDLDQQLQILSNDAPQYGVPSIVMEQAVTPVLKIFASQLQHLEYYVPQTLDRALILTTISNRQQPQVEKKVVYAFPTLQDAANFQGTADPQVLAISVPVTHILFQMFALKDIDSIIFLETPGNLKDGTEIPRSNLQKFIEAQIRELKNLSRSRNIPPNLA